MEYLCLTGPGLSAFKVHEWDACRIWTKDGIVILISINRIG